MTDIEFRLPDKSTPGYLRRQKEALRFLQQFKQDPSPETIDMMVDFLVGFVVSPSEEDAAKEALWDASQEQFELLLNSVVGREDDESNPTK